MFDVGERCRSFRVITRATDDELQTGVALHLGGFHNSIGTNGTVERERT
jgi:hypothetical protein